MTLLAVALASALGAACRYLVDAAVRARLTSAFPWGIWLVNVTGSFLLGLLVGLAPPAVVTATVGAGFLGSYTTFSTLAVDTVLLAENRRRRVAVANVAASLLGGLAAAVAGLALSVQLLRP